MPPDAGSTPAASHFLIGHSPMAPVRKVSWNHPNKLDRHKPGGSIIFSIFILSINTFGWYVVQRAEHSERLQKAKDGISLAE